MMERFTDHARAAVRVGFRHQPNAPEQDVIAALAGRGVAARLLHDIGFTADRLPAATAAVACRGLVGQAVQVARQRGAPYVGTEHLLLALAGLPGSALAAHADRLGELLSAAEGQCRRARPPLARRVGGWCRSVLRWLRG